MLTLGIHYLQGVAVGSHGDPLDDRRYALMDRDPTAQDNKSSTAWMANLLASCALALFPSAALSQRVASACWSGKGPSIFCWPVWEEPLSRDAVRSVLTHRALASDDYRADRNDLRSELRARGVVAFFSAQRIQVGNPPLHKLNFSQVVAC